MRVMKTKVHCSRTGPSCLMYSVATLSCPGAWFEFSLRTPASNSPRDRTSSSPEGGSSQQCRSSSHLIELIMRAVVSVKSETGGRRAGSNADVL